jgi:hypothetical protein
MRANFTWAALIVVLITFPTLSPAETVGLQADKSREISFQLVSGYLVVVEGAIGDIDHLKFILDTGATRSLIDLRLAKHLGLPLGSGVVLRLDTRVPIKSALLPNLTLGPLQGENLIVNVADLSHVGNSGARMDAIIGLDVLGSIPFQIDYKAMRVTFGPISSLAETASMDMVPGLPVVLLGQHAKSHLLIDTGARNIILYQEKFHAPPSDWKLVGTELWADSVGGVVMAKKTVFHDAVIGFDRGYKEVYLVHAPLDEPLCRVDGILSPTAFGIRVIGFDFDRQIVTWTR